MNLWICNCNSMGTLGFALITPSLFAPNPFFDGGVVHIAPPFVTLRFCLVHLLHTPFFALLSSSSLLPPCMPLSLLSIFLRCLLGLSSCSWCFAFSFSSLQLFMLVVANTTNPTHTHTHIFEIAKKSPKWWLETNITLNENCTQNQIYKTC